MVYGMKTIVVTKMQERKMDMAEMQMLCFSLGKIRLDKIKNDAIGVGEMRIRQRETGPRRLGNAV